MWYCLAVVDCRSSHATLCKRVLLPPMTYQGKAPTRGDLPHITRWSLYVRILTALTLVLCDTQRGKEHDMAGTNEPVRPKENPERPQREENPQV